jgi:transcriptional regulator with XRE-family HTH domain
MSQQLDYSLASNEAIEADLGQRIEAIRLGRNVNQTQLAVEAGVSRRTITRLENGGGVSVDTLIRVLRALGLAARLATLLPDPGVRPIERVRLKGGKRQRARPRATQATPRWTWAEDDRES